MTLVSTAAVQRNSQATYVYVVKADSTVTVRPIMIGTTEGDGSEVTAGLTAGEVVVMTGVDKLQEGTKVAAQMAPASPSASPAATPPVSASAAPSAKKAWRGAEGKLDEAASGPGGLVPYGACQKNAHHQHCGGYREYLTLTRNRVSADDRLRSGRRTERRQELTRFHRRSVHVALPPDPDDHHGRAVGSITARAGNRHWRRASPAAGHHHHQRAHYEPIADVIHNAGRVSLL